MALARRQQLALELGLLALVGYLAALGLRTALLDGSDLVPPPAAAREDPLVPSSVGALEDYTLIAERDIFNPPGGRDAPPLALRLWGVGFHGRVARAVIEDTATGRQELYAVGDAIGETRITAIDWDHVTVAHGGREVLLAREAEPTPVATEPAVEPPPADAGTRRIRQTGENAWVVDRRAITGATNGPSGLLTQLRAVAEVRDGRAAGFRLFRIDGESLFAHLGLEDGDVVERVNGESVTEPAALLGFLERLREEPRVALDIVRAGEPRTLVYDLR